MPEALPELGALAAAGFLLLIAAALWVLIDLLNNSLGRLPLVGSWITSNISNALNDARNVILAGASASWGAAVQLFKWMIDWIKLQATWEITAVTSVWHFGTRMYDVTLPNLETRVLVTASSWVSSAESFARGLYAQAVSYAAAEASRALAVASSWVSAAESAAVQLFRTAELDAANAVRAAERDAANALAAASTTLTADIAAAEQFTIAQVDALGAELGRAYSILSGDITAGVQTAEHLAAVNLGAAVGGIYTDLDTWGKQALADAWPDVTGDISALRRTLGADFPWLNDLLGALGGLGAAGLLGTLIQSMAGAHAITRLANDCIVPNCRNLSGLGNDLQNLLSTASTAAMLAWLIFAVTDPSGWAAEMGSVAAPVAAGLANDAARLFGGG